MKTNDALLMKTETLAPADGLASTLPTADGRGLSRAELAAVTAARNEAESRAGRFADSNADSSPAECGRVAAAVPLRLVLALRPRPSDPAPPPERGLGPVDLAGLDAED